MSKGTDTYPKSYISDMNLKGFAAKLMDEHFHAFSVDALKKNPSLMESLMHAKKGGKAKEDMYGLAGGKYVLDQHELSGKLLTGLAFLYAANPSPEVFATANEIVDGMINAQCSDGYLGVHEVEDRFGGGYGNWDLWGIYHAGIGLLEWYRKTGERKALNLSMSIADNCMEHFADITYNIGSEFANSAICHLYASLYEETRKKKYLDEAVRFVEKEWPLNGNWLQEALDGKAFYESVSPRWESLHGIMTLSILYRETGDERYFRAFEQIWKTIVRYDRHNTGAFSTREKALGSPYADGPIETCCSVAWLAYSIEYLRLKKDPQIADEMEWTYFNALYGAFMSNRREVTYSTPMNGIKISTQEALPFFYNRGCPDFNCCQANACRAMSEISQWAVMTDKEALTVNTYLPSDISTITPSGQEITIHMDTEYPVSGRVHMQIYKLQQNETFTMRFRIPQWSKKNSVLVNGQPVNGAEAGTYVDLNREWKSSDTVDVMLDMAVHFWVGEDNYASRTSVYYGPLLLAADDFRNSSLPGETSFTETDMRNIRIEDGKDNGCWVITHVTGDDGKDYTLTDFASTGPRKHQYVTWLNVKNSYRPLPMEDAWLNV